MTGRLRAIRWGCFTLLLMFLAPLDRAAAESLYVGSDACKGCHEPAYTAWQIVPPLPCHVAGQRGVRARRF